MALRLERSVEEAHLYMAMHPCEVCGESDFDCQSSVVMAEGDLASQYEGSCFGCDSRRSFVFRLPAEVSLPSRVLQFGGPEPSELIDAGEWLWVSRNFAAVGLVDDPAALSVAELNEARADFEGAAAAVDEVLKFLPDGVDKVPDRAFWTDRGLRMRAQDPTAFRRDQLVALRDAYRATLAALPRPGDEAVS
ncbi:hypothetical protein ACFYO0_24235 [Streptomyces sp. NPDC006365]|uniref:hypothetical protein n=1 Tax=Streptomyces sp. NPDC006365 TaxID=3364744 RepID=UPI0036C033DA